MKKLGRRQRLLEINKMMLERKNRYVIYNELRAQGVSVSRADVNRDVEMINEISKMIRKDYSSNRIFNRLGPVFVIAGIN